MKKVLAACAMYLCATVSACAEPVSLTLALSTLLGGAFVSVAAVTTALNIGLALAVSVGLSFASSALQKKPGQGAASNSSYSKSLNSPEVRYNERQATPSKRIIVGTAQVGGALFFEESKSGYLFLGLLVCAEKISAFRRVFIGANEVAIHSTSPGLPVDQILTPQGRLTPGGRIVETPRYDSRLLVSLRLGDANQTIDPLIDDNYTLLNHSFRQRGIATAVFGFFYGSDYEEFRELWGQVQRPNPLLVVDGVAVYDPRDPTQVIDNPDTWKFSNNATLVQAYYLTKSFGGRIPVSKIDWAKVAESADYDDELVGCKDGTFIKRYTIDGLFTLNQPPVEVMRGMLSANRGRVLESGGTVWVQSSKPQTSVGTIYDGILAGGFEYRAAKPKKELINRCRVRFIAEDREYQIADGPVLSLEDYQEEDGEILDGTLDLPFTLDHRRAQRLQKAYIESSRLGKTLTCRVDLEFMANCNDEPIGKAVTVDSELFPQINGTYFIEAVGFSQDYSSLELGLSEYDPSIETDWRFSVDQQDFELEDLDVT